MTLKEYFESIEGKGILSSANSDGRVSSAIYSKPHVFDDGTVALVMRKKLTYENLKTNPRASYMFIEGGYGYEGIRLSLIKTREESDSELIDTMKRQSLTPEEDKAKGPKFLVYFQVNAILPLIGDGESGITIK